VLEAIGLQAPILYPEQALLFRLVSTGAPSESDGEHGA
jgi:hypothetical protein